MSITYRLQILTHETNSKKFVCLLFSYFEKKVKGQLNTELIQRIGSGTWEETVRIVSVADPGCLSRVPGPNFPIPDPGSGVKKIPDPGSAKIIFSVFNPKNCF
jgi:hypothetical protein